MLRAGCSGFPVARSSYFRRLGAVEIVSSFLKPPKPETARTWREEAPSDFDFCVQAWQRITHLPSSPSYARAGEKDAKAVARCGHFKPSDEVQRAWQATAELAETLRARFVLFRTASTFYPNADHLRDMYRFFKAVRRRTFALAWEPRGEWEPALVARICGDLGLTRAGGPEGKPAQGGLRYVRVSDRARGFRRGAAAPPPPAPPAELARSLDGGGFVFFDSPDAWRQALAFEEALRPSIPRRARPCVD